MKESVRNNTRLRDLYGLYSKIGEQILGSTGTERRDLIRLRRRVRDEILSIERGEPQTSDQDDGSQDT